MITKDDIERVAETLRNAEWALSISPRIDPAYAQSKEWAQLRVAVLLAELGLAVEV
jgi:hypothetical protein